MVMLSDAVIAVRHPLYGHSADQPGDAELVDVVIDGCKDNFRIFFPNLREYPLNGQVVMGCIDNSVNFALICGHMHSCLNPVEFVLELFCIF